uniref:Uncharacterized protein n=1 Tax=Leersia perrieri TaxID=77586 RepID=A0A0D9VTR8_9ORYZ
MVGLPATDPHRHTDTPKPFPFFRFSLPPPPPRQEIHVQIPSPRRPRRRRPGRDGGCGCGSVRWGISGNISRPPSPHDGGAATRGHLGLIRAHPELRELNEALPDSSRDALFLDATYVLTGSALRVPTLTSSHMIRMLCEYVEAAESRADRGPDELACFRVRRSILKARDGRFDEALSYLARLAGDSPDDHRPRIAAAALCLLHGRRHTSWRSLVAAMPGSSPQCGEENYDSLVMFSASTYLYASLDEKMKTVERSMLYNFLIRVFRELLVNSRTKQSDATIIKYLRALSPDNDATKSPSLSVMGFSHDMAIVESIQAILSGLLRLRRICGERLREVHSIAEKALAQAEAESNMSAVIDINIFLAFLEIRDGQLEAAKQRYKAALKQDPHDCRLHALFFKFGLIFGNDRDLFLQNSHRFGVQMGHRAEQLPALLNEVVIASALGSGGHPTVLNPSRSLFMIAAWREVDEGLTAALGHGELTFWQRMQLRFLRRLPRAKMQPLLLDMAKDGQRDSVVHQ